MTQGETVLNTGRVKVTLPVGRDGYLISIGPNEYFVPSTGYNVICDDLRLALAVIERIENCS